MREYEVLKELVANISDWKTRQKMCHNKPFKACYLDVIISPLAPQFYSKQELGEVNNVHKLLSKLLNESETENTKSMRRKRSRKIKETQEDERMMEKNKKAKHEAPPPELATVFKNRIAELNGEDIKFLMHKTLFMSDLEQNNNRLSMPLSKFMCEFLTEAEKANLEERNGAKGRPQGLEVTVLDPNLREFSLQLKKWKMQSTHIYNLVKNWNNIVSANDFKKDQQLQIWSFRVHHNLYFLLC
ncbi:hypothetical protein VNO77_02401 [Canavalia gladiata]|uniref:Uncharacterized protein n=1 Tax=Canavalia gladiata TaxID=3824 RepID=A0AAN9R777_CANGL